MTIRGVVFDLDGVIADTEPIQAAADLELFAGLGLELKRSDIVGYAGVTAPEVFADLKRRFAIDRSVPELLALKRPLLRRLLAAETPPVPGIRELLDRLGAAKLALAVASSTFRELVELMLDKLGLRSRFAAIVAGDEVERSKPAPDIFLEAARRLGLPAGELAAIEDSASGSRAAAAAGMAVIGFANPASGEQDLAAARVVVRRLDEITPALLAGLDGQDKER